ncbi:hypothetical protein Amet_3963 [Alkaliphilus metalliredigens QYMF]|uniref:Uncharacterized protein n=1 Tax=Alkaliphilus metalliredigens (strain QYMF) TaxID=293826 RepID=A6TV32_ALKMQ|nr:hypothetical protein [Alkaliphilus metalliredigens]ABR50050.1 hypothetical protein Amet_3963 [Alkaliphilus metalliredigens QYMF]
MEKKNKTEKVCPCGRIIADPNNKTGLCPKCQKTGINIGGALGVAGIVILVKKHGKKIIKGAINVIKNIK